QLQPRRLPVTLPVPVAFRTRLAEDGLITGIDLLLIGTCREGICDNRGRLVVEDRDDRIIDARRHCRTARQRDETPRHRVGSGSDCRHGLEPPLDLHHQLPTGESADSSSGGGGSSDAMSIKPAPSVAAKWLHC
ncbi:hypothetical protein Vretifemale_1538, partial [Volvox reticuliferus]